jgi:phenylalanyl-tRNA synthetase beta chain
VSVREFDRYQGKGVPDGQVSLSIRLIFRHPGRTLTDADVHEAIDGIVRALETRHQAVLRGR